MTMRSIFHTLIHDADGNVKHDGAYRGNLRTTDGLDAQAAQLGHVGSQPAAFGWLAVTADATSPSTSDHSLAGEITTGGLARASTTYSHTSGVASFSESATMTASGTFTINKEALFNASGPPVAGTMGFESLEPSPPSVLSGDVVTTVVTVNI